MLLAAPQCRAAPYSDPWPTFHPAARYGAPIGNAGHLGIRDPMGWLFTCWTVQRSLPCENSAVLELRYPRPFQWSPRLPEYLDPRPPKILPGPGGTGPRSAVVPAVVGKGRVGLGGRVTPAPAVGGAVGEASSTPTGGGACPLGPILRATASGQAEGCSVSCRISTSAGFLHDKATKFVGHSRGFALD
jgi:hypothetical protein